MMGYNLRDRSAVKRKLSPEPGPEVKTRIPKRRKTAKTSKKTIADDSLPNAISIPSSSAVLESQPPDEVGPVERVLNTAELLEMILLNVYDGNDQVISCIAMKTVLLSQRVSKFFKATIDGSAKLERALWRLPDEEVSNSFAGTMQIRLNPLLRASLRHNRRPFAEASVIQHSKGSFLKIMCTVDGFFGDGCESSKAMILVKTARQDYSCEITFRLQGGLHREFTIRCPKDSTVGDLEDTVSEAMTSLVRGKDGQRVAQELRVAKEKSASRQ